MYLLSFLVNPYEAFNLTLGCCKPCYKFFHPLYASETLHYWKNMILLRNKLFFKYKKMHMQNLFMYHVFEKIYTSDFNFDSNFYGNLIFEKATYSPNIWKATYFTYWIGNPYKYIIRIQNDINFKRGLHSSNIRKELDLTGNIVSIITFELLDLIVP